MCKLIGKAKLKQVFIFSTGGNCGLFSFLKRKKALQEGVFIFTDLLLIDCCWALEDYCKIIAEMFCHSGSKQLIVIFVALKYNC